MTPTAEEVFTTTVRGLPPNERLRLAALILDDFARSDLEVVQKSDSWSQQDRMDLTAFSLKNAAELYPEEEELV